MKFITPLGFIAIISVVLLIVIYLIKPNYKNKTVSSTYIWKESLKYRKKDKKESIFRNILTFICQAAVLVSATFIIAYPMIVVRAEDNVDVNVIIIDASADMKASDGKETRFSRALSYAEEVADKSVKKKIPVTVILDSFEATCIAENELSSDTIKSALASAECGTGSGNIASALALAKKSAGEDKFIKVYYYTATEYENVNGVDVINVAKEGDFNISVTDLKSENNENYYDFTAKIASVGKEEYLSVVLTVNGVNDENSVRRLEQKVNCPDGKLVEVKFDDTGIYSYKNAVVNVSASDGSEDGIPEDDSYYLYDGEKESLKIQYSSTAHNNFISGQLLVLQETYSDRYDIEISEPTRASQIKTSGFDFYIFEHSYPSVMPKDGVVFLIDAPTVPVSAGITTDYKKNGNFGMTAGVVSPITRFMDIRKITATTYYPLKPDESSGYETLMYCDGDPVLVAKNEENSKIIVLGLNLNTSNFSLLFGFPVFMNNVFEYYFPVTTDKLVYDSGDTVTVTARGSNVKYADGTGTTAKDSSFTVRTEKTGSCSVTQTLISGQESVTNFFVKIPEKESLLNKTEKEIFGADSIRVAKEESKDIYLYLAIAALAFLIAERLLYSFKTI